MRKPVFGNVRPGNNRSAQFGIKHLKVSYNIITKMLFGQDTAKEKRSYATMKRNIKTINTAIRTAVYQTLVRPRRIRIHSMEPFHSNLHYKIEIVQRRTVRWVSSNYFTCDSVSSMLDSLGWRSFEDRRANARLILFYKIVSNLVAVPLPQYINHPVRMTRHMHTRHFVQIPATASYCKYLFFPLAIVQWNRLPHHIPVLSDLASFRSAVRTVSHLMP